MNKHVTRQALGSQDRDRLEISIRSYVAKPSSGKKKATRKPPPPPSKPSEWTLIFDTETTVDHRQRLRFGAYQIRHGDQLVERGRFFDPDAMTATEIALLKRTAEGTDIQVMPVRQFVTKILFGIAYDLDATVVGFNLPFDLSRLAIHASPARGTMKGGFSLKLTADPHLPNLRIKSLSSKASLIQWTATGERRDTRSMRRKKIAAPVRRGYFVDVKTIAAALLSRSFSLADLAEFLGTDARKGKTDEHGDRLTADYIAYADQDVETTWQAYKALRDKYRGYRLSTPLHRILSEASLGKAYLKQMNIRPWRKVQPDFSPDLIGIIMSTYYGGRAEVHLRRDIAQVLYCDFLSMYPTVCTLMGLWRYVIATGVDWSDTTERTQEWLDRVTEADFQRQPTWRKLTTLVQVLPDGEIFPVRAQYSDDAQATIGLNHLHSQQPLWFTLADCVAAKFLSGKTPRIIQAVTFKPKAKQTGLEPVAIGGSQDFVVDPARGDFYRSAIDQRSAVKARMKQATGAEANGLEAQQMAIKLLANSTSYGIFIELNVLDLEEPTEVECYSPSAGVFQVKTQAIEQAGSYFHPLLATLITGAARLMLALAERQTLSAGLDWCFCDTDSMALIRPKTMTEGQFYETAKRVCAWFEPLNPYAVKGPLFKIEDANFDFRTGELAPLMCLAISSKRYVLFNENASGSAIIRKASLHGLGHLLPPYERREFSDRDDAEDARHRPGILPWQHDLWLEIINAAKGPHPEQVRLNFHQNMNYPAVSRYAVTTPSLHKMFAEFNRGNSYAESVKPFNFLLALQAENIVWKPDPPPFPGSKRKIGTVTLSLRPVAPYSRNPQDAARNSFDRVNGRPIDRQYLKTYRSTLAQYHLRPEMKFQNGDYLDRGLTIRRNVEVAGIRHIGKEANRLEEQYFMGLQPDAQVNYGLGRLGLTELLSEVRNMVRALGQRRVAADLGISRGCVGKLCKGDFEAIAPQVLNAIERGIPRLRTVLLEKNQRTRSLRQMVKSAIDDVGLSAAAKWLGSDPSNLRKFATGLRDMSEEQMTRVEFIFRERVRTEYGV
ncbi:hypothetical protein [Phreatobacter sp.]|uniref:hypothetical protein n=1 Tax=Phreatobacter sp. TaxID=1966341 RepID=UPI003F7134F1